MDQKKFTNLEKKLQEFTKVVKSVEKWSQNWKKFTYLNKCSLTRKKFINLKRVLWIFKRIMSLKKFKDLLSLLDQASAHRYERSYMAPFALELLRDSTPCASELLRDSPEWTTIVGPNKGWSLGTLLLVMQVPHVRSQNGGLVEHWPVNINNFDFSRN